MVTEKQVKKLQAWYSRKNDGWTLSETDALEILRNVEWWGYSIFNAAYDLVMGDDPQ